MKRRGFFTKLALAIAAAPAVAKAEIEQPMLCVGQRYIVNQTFTVPNGVAEVRVSCVGAGGSGQAHGQGMGGGASGRYEMAPFLRIPEKR